MEYMILVPLILQIFGLAASVIIDPYIKKRDKRIMQTIVVLVFGVLVVDVAEYILNTIYFAPGIRLVFAVLGYCSRPAILMLFLCIISRKKFNIFAWILVAFNALLNSTAFYSYICFTINADNHYCGGPLSEFTLYLSVFLLICLFVETIKRCIDVHKRDMIIPVIVIISIPAGFIADHIFNPFAMQLIDYTTISIVFGSMMYYIWLHMQFVREHEQSLMAEQRIQIMMTQIQPHFLYNTLSTIQALCRIDPEKAFDTTEKFGLYLRQNIDSLSQPNLIPIKKELEHTKLYADIEMIRFQNINVEYDIKDETFSVPALTVQPIVENAIKHGVRIRKEGLVKVHTHKTDNFHEIIISDNGKGFDTSHQLKAEEGHIGLYNVEERLAKMCRGTMSIDSRIDEGTTITIRIPMQNSSSSKHG